MMQLMKGSFTPAGTGGTLAALALTFAAGLSPAIAQTISASTTNLPDRVSDQAERRVERADEASRRNLDGPPILTSPANRAELPAAGGPTVLLRSVTFSGSSAFLSREELDAIKAPYVGRRVDFRDISAIIRAVNDLYAEKQVVTAAAVLPPQDLSAGRLEVQLVEGQLGAVGVLGQNATRSDYVLSRIRLANGTTVDTPTATRDIIRFNRTNKAQARLLLKPGETFGTTDVFLGLVEPPAHRLDLIADNEGVTSTGEYQTSLIYQRYGALGIDDTFLLYGQASQGARSGSARLDMPITRWGTRMSVSGTLSQVNVVDGASAILDIKGRSASAGLSLSQPLYVSQAFMFSAIGSAFAGNNTTKSGSVKLVDSQTRKYAFGGSAAYYGKAVDVSLQAQAVSANVHDRLASSTDDVWLATGQLQASYAFADGRTQATLFAAGQYTDADLVPGNLLFEAGGPATVRGYPSNGIAGDSGFYASAQINHRLNLPKENVTAFAFLDYGQIFSTFPDVTTLASVGGGLDFGLTERANLRFTGAIPLRDVTTDQLPIAAYVSLSVRLY